MKRDVELRIKAIESLLVKPHIEPAGRVQLLRCYADANRQARVLNVKQWETARALAEGWHGTEKELIQTAKDLA